MQAIDGFQYNAESALAAFPSVDGGRLTLQWEKREVGVDPCEFAMPPAHHPISLCSYLPSTPRQRHRNGAHAMATHADLNAPIYEHFNLGIFVLGLLAAALMLLNIVVDVLYGVFDPRVRVDGRG